MTTNFNEKPNFPFTYGDDVINDGQRLSDYVVNTLSDKKTQKYLGSVAAAAFALGAHASQARAIPAENGETVNNIINQAGQAGATVPPIGELQGHVPNVPGGGVPEGNTRCFIPAMPIEQQRLIAAQQAGNIGPGHPGAPNGNNSPIFWAPKPPVTDVQRLRSTAIFLLSTAGVCSQAGWNPIAQVMCAAGLALSSYAVSKNVFIAVFRSLSGGG